LRDIEFVPGPLQILVAGVEFALENIGHRDQLDGAVLDGQGVARRAGAAATKET
jgi:hypothetical protein